MLLPGFEKAKIIIDQYGSTREEVTCIFNPSQYSIKNKITYAKNTELNGQDAGVNYPASTERELSVVLYFDSMGPPSLTTKAAAKVSPLVMPVTCWTSRLARATKPGPMGAIPMVSFVWGNLFFTGKVTELSESYTMFSSDGKPIRAKVDLTIKESLPTTSGLGKLAGLAEGLTKCRTVVSGMSLWAIAFEEYGSCDKWREIAKANKIKNPLDLRPGQKLKLP